MSVSKEGNKEALQVNAIMQNLRSKVLWAMLNDEITPQRASEIFDWIENFIKAYELPLPQRVERMREVIKDGISNFSDVKLMKEFASALGIRDRPRYTQIRCPTCKGTGRERCSYCDGMGILYGDLPSGYIGMPIRTPCDKCCGKGYDVCSNCDGTGYVNEYY